jgi:hypothetical protein
VGLDDLSEILMDGASVDSQVLRNRWHQLALAKNHPCDGDVAGTDLAARKHSDDPLSNHFPRPLLRLFVFDFVTWMAEYDAH